MTGYFIFQSTALILLFIISTLAVALRLWARKIQRIRLISADYLIVVGLVFTLADVICFLYYNFRLLALGGQDHRESQVETPEVNTLVLQLTVLTHVLFSVSIGFIRSSIILLYIHIFPTHSFHLTCYAVLLFNGAYSIAEVLAKCLICSPIACSWDSSVACTSCGNTVAYDLTYPILNLVLDITMVVLPIPMIWNLQMPKAKKAMIGGIFGLGLFICAITSYRLRVVIGEILGGDPNTSTNNFLIGLEIVLGVLNACLPVLRPTIHKAGDWIKSISGSGRTSPSIIGNSPVLIHVSQKWNSRFKRRSGREELDSIFEMEGYGTNQNAIQSTDGPRRVVGMKDTEIHVQRDVDVERASNQK